MSDAGEVKEWCVDYTVDVLVTVSKIVTVQRTEIHEGATAEEAVQAAKDDLFLEVSDVEGIEPEDFELDEPNMDTFKVNGNVTPWQA
jgi:hypothetical protein